MLFALRKYWNFYIHNAWRKWRKCYSVLPFVTLQTLSFQWHLVWLLQMFYKCCVLFFRSQCGSTSCQGGGHSSTHRVSKAIQCCLPSIRPYIRTTSGRLRWGHTSAIRPPPRFNAATIHSCQLHAPERTPGQHACYCARRSSQPSTTTCRRSTAAPPPAATANGGGASTTTAVATTSTTPIRDGERHA